MKLNKFLKPIWIWIFFSMHIVDTRNPRFLRKERARRHYHHPWPTPPPPLQRIMWASSPGYTHGKWEGLYFRPEMEAKENDSLERCWYVFKTIINSVFVTVIITEISNVSRLEDGILLSRGTILAW